MPSPILIRARAYAVHLLTASGVVAAFLAVDAEGKSLEDIAKPLGVIGGSAEGIFRSGDPRQGGVAAGD